MMTSGLSFDLLPIDGCNISPSPTDEYNTVVDFLFVDHNSKKIGIHFFDFMPNKDNLEWESSMNNMGVPYNNIYPALKNLYINEEKKTNAKILSTTRTILLSTYLRSRF
ncbi:MAG: hypothetical protein LBD11_07405 [Candidatus Peribacteria bacterium]|jgi:hypothetical protein|nr:hypothetical protein [Candidatus Peribacteria bacterium]